MAGEDLENLTFLREEGLMGGARSLELLPHGAAACSRFPILVLGIGVCLTAVAGVLRNGYVRAVNDITATQQKIEHACDGKGCFGEGQGSKLTFNGMCVGVDPNHVRNGAVVQLRPCNEHGNHIKWHFTGLHGQEGKLHIKANRSLCLDVKGHLFHPQTPLQLWKCEDWNQDQLLQISTAPGDRYRLGWSRHPNYFVDVKDGNNASWTPVQIWTYGKHQLFYDS